jgi:choline kinase
MKAIILAAGRGSRLKGFTDSRPKCLNTVGGQTILQRQILALQAGGVDEIVIVTGYRADMLEQSGLKTIYNAEWETTNMVRSLLCAKSEFDKHLIVSYSDIIYSSEVVRRLSSQGRDAVIVYDKNWKDLWKLRFRNPLEDAESFRIDKKGRLMEIGLPVKDIDEIQGQYTGLMRYTPRTFSWIVEFLNKQSCDIDKIDMTTLLFNLVCEGYPIYGMPIYGGWCEIDTVTDLELANRLYDDGCLESL